MSQPDREAVIKQIRACIASSKGGVPLSNLSRDYHMLIGDPLPYQKLGFTKLEDFLRSISNLRLTNGPKGELLVQAGSSERNSQLARLVAMHESSNKARFIPRTPKRANEAQTPSRKPWTRNTISNSLNNNNNNNSNTGRSLRTPSLLRNLSQPSSNPKTNAPLNRTQSSPSSKSNPRNSGKTSPDAKVIPPLLSLEVSPPVSQLSLRKPSMSIDRRRQSNSQNPDVVYSPVVCPAANVRKPTAPTAEIKATEHITKLKKYVHDKNLGEIEFKTIEMLTESTKQYVSSINIGKDFKVSTYPNFGNTAQEAMDMAAKHAYEKLQIELNNSPDLPATENSNEALKRIIQILKAHPNGVWANKVPNQYMGFYGEQLPSDWLKQVMACPQVDSNVISEKQIILTLVECTTQQNQPKKTTCEQQDGAKKSQDKGADKQRAKASVPVDKKQDSGQQKETATITQSKGEKVLSPEATSPLLPVVSAGAPPPLTLPKEENWDVYVTNANSTTQVWLRLVGEEYSSLYENLATEMELHFLGSSSQAKEVVEGGYYALELDDCVHRVQVVALQPPGVEALCLLLDHGQMEKVAVKELRPLEPRFLALPFQAVQCELRGLEQYASAEGVQALLLEVVTGKTLVAQVVQSEVLGRPYTLSSPSVALLLFDTSTEEDVDLNQQLWRTITTTVLLPRLPQEGQLTEVAVSHVTSQAHIFVQVHASVLVSLQDKIAALQPALRSPGSVTLPTKDRLYLAPFEDGVWYRAAVIAVKEDTAQLVFVDYGNKAKVATSKLLDLEAVAPDLAQVPHQAVLCRLHHLLPDSSARVCERTVARLAALLPTDRPQLLKVVSAAAASTPASVELFLRIEPDNLLVSLNNTLRNNPDIFDRGDEPRETGERPSSVQEKDKDKAAESVPRGLSQPKIPEIGGFLDVNVTMAASPCNFVVQPWSQCTELGELMVALQSLYGTGGTHVQPLTSADVQDGGIYTAKHHDGKWYRVQVNSLLTNGLVSLLFVDYGDHSVMTVDQLRPLAAKFCKLPYQAIKAKLSGIRPKHSDWNVEDCVRFHELVCNRQFVSVVEETGPDLINPSDTVLGLRLVDTSDEFVDINIGELLVKEDRALFTT